MYHAYGQTYYIANFSKLRIPYYIMPSFDFVKLLQHVEEYRISHLICVPPIVVALAKHPLSRKHDLSSVFSIGSGAAPLARETIEEVQRLWPQGAVKVRQAWGMTEVTCTCIGWDPKYDATTASVGEMMPNCSARLMELDGKTPIERANTPGELWVTGPTLMRGYWRKPEATAATIWVDPVDGTRWLRTGDIAFVEDYAPGALFHIVDRLKELIKVKGNQVAPAELEGVLLERPDVTDAAVVGVTINGEELPRAYIVRAPGSSTSEQEMAEWLAGKVARFKRLRGGVKFIDEIPKNPVSNAVDAASTEKAWVRLMIHVCPTVWQDSAKAVTRTGRRRSRGSDVVGSEAVVGEHACVHSFHMAPMPSDEGQV